MKQYADKPFVLLGVNSDPDRAAIKKTLAEQNLPWRSWWDDGSVDGPIQTEWQVVQRPTLYLLDGEGVIRHKLIQPDELDAAIEQLVEELTAKS